MKASTLGTTNSVADVLQSAVVAIIDNVEGIKVTAMNDGTTYHIHTVFVHEGFVSSSRGTYFSEGVTVTLDDEIITIRQIAKNAFISGEVTLTGSMTRNFELIVGSIESALGMAL